MISYRPLSNENSALNTHSGDLFMASDSHCLARKLLGSFRTKDVTLVLEKSDYLKLGVSIIPAYLSFLIKNCTRIEWPRKQSMLKSSST